MYVAFSLTHPRKIRGGRCLITLETCIFSGAFIGVGSIYVVAARRGFNQVLNSMTGMDDNIVRVWNKGWDQYVNKALRNYKNAPRPGRFSPHP